MRRLIAAVAAVVWMVVWMLAGVPRNAAAQQPAALSGIVVDSLGARLPGATVTLLRGGQRVQETTSNDAGEFSFPGVAPDRYQIEAALAGFQSRTSDALFVGAGGRAGVELVLEIGTLRQDVVVTAGATELLQARTGAPITVIDAPTIEVLNKLDLLESLRLVPGSQIVQVGQRGGVTSFFVRGGSSNFTKVLMDGIPANDIGGGFDFSQLQASGVGRVEVMRQTNSVIYGSDALAGVINIETPRGSSRVPAFEYRIDGGNLGTFNNAISIGGAVRRFDYFSQYSYYRTDNALPNNGYDNGTYAGRFGVALGNGTNLYGTVRHLDGNYGSPNAFSLFGVADDSRSESRQTYVSVAADAQLSARWQTSVRFGSIDQHSVFTNPTPTGESFDPFGFGPNYLGNPVTLQDAAGRTVTGRAILDFGGTYPSGSDNRTTRRSLLGQATFQATPDVAISAGGRVERENGYSGGGDDPVATRNNGGGFVEARATLATRIYVSGGIGVEHNAVFQTAFTPRLSVAAYLRNPSAGGMGETKLTLNAGNGIKAPNVFQSQNSLYELVVGTPAGAGVEPVGPERSRSFDVGVEQAFAGSRLRARIAYFNNTFTDLLEYLSPAALVQAGVPPEVAQATGFGAYINSSSYDAQGIELSADAVLGGGVRLNGSYTFLDAEVTEAFGAGAAFNPLIPGVPIGAYSPLVGARPFRRPAHSGTLFASYTAGPFDVAVAGYLVGASDDSTFLSDEFFGNTLLLPNADLARSYQKIDLSASYRLLSRFRVYTSIENLLDQEYEAAYGFPALPATVRVGASIRLGGD